MDEAFESRARINRFDAQLAAIPFNLDGFAGGEDLIEDRVDVLAEFRGREFHAQKTRRTYVTMQAYVRTNPRQCQSVPAVPAPIPAVRPVLHAHKKL